MAFQLLVKAEDNQIGHEFPEAYARVGDAYTNKTHSQVQINIYASKAAADRAQMGVVPILQDARYIPVEELEAYMQQNEEKDVKVGRGVYRWLKANVPLFEDAIDVLENTENVPETVEDA